MSYDSIGRVTAKTSPLGVETYTYDSLDRITSYLVDGVALAVMTYDSFSRIATIEYPEAKDSSGNKFRMTQVKRDQLQRTTGAQYITSDGKLYDESTVLSQIGKTIGATQTFNGQTLNSNFSFDKIGRLTSATVGQTKFDYSYGAPDAICSSAAGITLMPNETATEPAPQQLTL